MAVDALRDGDGGQTRHFYGVALGVGDGHAHADGGDALPFPFPDVLFVGIPVGQVPHLVVQLRQQVDGGLLGLHIRADDDGLRREKCFDVHDCYPFSAPLGAEKLGRRRFFTSTIIA